MMTPSPPALLPGDGTQGICERREFGGDVYLCGRLLGPPNIGSKPERCLGGTFICPQCFDTFEEFVDAAYNANAREAEWESS
jgi:hypothetical protein